MKVKTKQNILCYRKLFETTNSIFNSFLFLTLLPKDVNYKIKNRQNIAILNENLSAEKLATSSIPYEKKTSRNISQTKKDNTMATNMNNQKTHNNKIITQKTND